jgi:hypothetical protein
MTSFSIEFSCRLDLFFKFQESHYDLNKIAKYLSSLALTLIIRQIIKPVPERMVNSKNQFSIFICQRSFLLKGTLLQFSGLSARRFYFLPKNTIDWKILINSSRFDIYYSRENNKN